MTWIDTQIIDRVPENMRAEFVAASERIRNAADERKMLRLNDMKDYLLRVLPYSDRERALCPDWSVSSGRPLGTKHYLSMLSLARNKSQVVRFSPEFSKLLIESPAPAFYDTNVMRTVYPVIIAEFDGGIYLKQFEMTLHCLLMWACAPDEEEQMFTVKLEKNAPDGKYFFGTFGLGYDRTGLCDCFAMPWMFDAEGRHINNNVEWCELFGVARAAFDLLASPSVKLEATDVTKLNKSRKKKNQLPLVPYEVVQWSRESASSGASGTSAKHRYRYDVRGNLATFERGPLAGRRIWRKPHQRGLANPVHKGHIYELKE